MLKAVSAAAVLVVAGTTFAGPFNLNSIDLGGDTASFGTPITVTGGTYYQDAFGNNYPPSSAFIGFFPNLQWDSYIAMDGNGPSTASHTANGPGGSTPGFGATMGHFPNTTTLTGGYFTGGGAPSGTSYGGYDGILIAQLTVSHGASIGSDAVRPSIGGEDFGGANATDMVLNGAVVPADSGRIFRIKAYLSATNNIGGSDYDTYEVWLEEVPTPGTIAGLGFAGLLGLRRRRA